MSLPKQRPNGSARKLKHFGEIMKAGGPEADALLEYIHHNKTLYLDDEVASLANGILEWERNKEREAVAFTVWREKVADRIRKGKLPITLEELDRMDARDMLDDVRAHSIRKRAQEREEETSRAFENIPVEQLEGVLTWYKYPAEEAGERRREDFDDVLIDISCRRKRADQYIFGASHLLQALLDKTYVKLVGLYDWAWRETKLRPWHALKTQDRLLREDSGSDKFDEYYLSELLRAETLTHNLSHAHARTLMCALRTMAAARWLRRRRLQRDSLWILDWWPWWQSRLRQGHRPQAQVKPRRDHPRPRLGI